MKTPNRIIKKLFLEKTKYGFAFSTNSSLVSYVLNNKIVVYDYQQKKRVKCITVKQIESPPSWNSKTNEFTFVADKTLWLYDCAKDKLIKIVKDNFWFPSARRFKGGWDFLKGLLFETKDNFLKWDPLGKPINYFVTKTANTYSLVKFNLISKQKQLLFQCSDQPPTSFDISANAQYVLYTILLKDSDNYEVRLYDQQTKTGYLISKERYYLYLQPTIKAIPWNNNFLIRTTRNQLSKLYLVNTSLRSMAKLVSFKSNIYNWIYSPTQKQVYVGFKRNNFGQEAIALISLKKQVSKKLFLVKEPGVNIPLFVNKDEELFYLNASPQNLGGLKQKRLSQTKSSSILPLTSLGNKNNLFITPEEKLVLTADNEKMYLQLYKPKNLIAGKKYSCVIVIRGGPTNSSYLLPQSLCSLLAQQNYFVLLSNYRGSTGFGTNWTQAVRGIGIGQKDLSDIISTVAYAKKDPRINSKNIAIYGKSWGGYLALLCGCKYPKLFKCVIADSSISDWKIQFAKTEIPTYDQWLFKSKNTPLLKKLKSLSPINITPKSFPPNLIICGQKDKNTPYEQSANFVSKLQKLETETTSLFFKNEGHIYQDPRVINQWTRKILTFLNRYLV